MDFAFIAKKLVSIMIMPLSLVFFLAIIGLFFLFRNNIKKSKIFITSSILLLLVFSYQPFSNTLLKPLENSYPKLETIPKDVKYILLLGGDLQSRGWEALRLYNKLDGAKIITSGYAATGTIPEAVKTANILYDIGIPKKDIIIHSKPRDTKEEAIKIKELLADKSFFLITSAHHMPRAIALFKKEGLNPIAAPSNSYSNNIAIFSFPSSGNIVKVNIALHEYIGLLWAKVTGQI